MAFYSQFRGWINLGILGVQLGVASRLYGRIGIPLSLAISPLIYLIGFLGLSIRLSLPTGVGAMSGTKLQDNAVYDPAVRVLFNLFPEASRARAMALLEGPVKRAGSAIGSVTIIIAVSLGSAVAVGMSALPIALVWLVAALILWRSYPALLLQASASPARLGEDFDVSEMLDVNTLRSLSSYLKDPDPARCRIAIDLVSEGQPELATSILAEAAREAPAETRQMLIAALDRVLERAVGTEAPNPEAVEHLNALIRDSAGFSDRDRADLIQAYGRVTTGASEESPDPVLAAALEDESAAVRLVAGAAIQRRGTPRIGGFDLDRALRDAAESGDPVVRRAAREEYRALLLGGEPDDVWQQRLADLTILLAHDDDRAETVEALVDIAERHGAAANSVRDAVLLWREDADVRTRAEVLRFIGFAGLEEYSALLVSHVGASSDYLRAAAREGLRALGPRAADALLVELSFGRRAARDAILPLVRELDVDRATLRELYERELDSYRHKLVTLHAAVRASVSPMLSQRLGERLDEGLHTALHLLAAAHDDDRISDLAVPLRRARGQRRHAILLEALEALLTPGEQAQLVPLLEDRTVAERGRAAAQALAVAVPKPGEVKRALLEEPDDLTRLLAEASFLTPTGAEPGSTLAGSADVRDDGGVLSPVERAMLLRGIPLFEELTTRQLMNVAEVVEEEEHPPNTVICRGGESSDCMYFIVDGVVAITNEAGAVLNELGPNDFFGEIAIFEGATRSANVVTRSSQTCLLRLKSDDLMNLMEELPAIAICICRTLSRRLRDLTRRVNV
jgi:hypothetical protein